jgi:hypothetical protein
VASPSSFDNIKNKWFPEIKHHAPGVPFILVRACVRACGLRDWLGSGSMVWMNGWLGKWIDRTDRLIESIHSITTSYWTHAHLMPPINLRSIHSNFPPDTLIQSNHAIQFNPTNQVGTKTDLRKDAEFARKTKLVTAEQGQLLASELGAYKHCECSALTQVHESVCVCVCVCVDVCVGWGVGLDCSMGGCGWFGPIGNPDSALKDDKLTHNKSHFHHPRKTEKQQEGLKPVFDEAIRCVLEHQNKPQKKKNKCVVC